MLPLSPLRLPDFRVLGVILRCLILSEALRVISVLTHTSSIAQAPTDFLQGAILFEPALVMCLLALFVMSPWIAGLSYRAGVGVVFGVVLSIVFVLQTLLESFEVAGGSHTAQVLVAASAVTAALLFYFSWLQTKLTPGLAHANLLALQARIQPHFLFNSLNSVLSLIHEDPKRAEVMLENLSDLFRAVLADTRSLVTLGQEITLAKTYLDIENIRLGERLQVRWQCDPSVENTLLPPLVLQPLVENAVVHGISPRPDGGIIQIKTFQSQGDLVMAVSNPKASPKPVGNGSHTAIENIRSRLELHFDIEGRLEIKESDDEFKVQIRIPLNVKKSDQNHHR